MSGVDLRIRIASTSSSRDGNETAELTEAFADWLAQDRSVGPYMEIRKLRTASGEGAMSGDLADWLSLVVSSGFSTAALLYSHQAYRASLLPRLRREARLVVEHEGTRVIIESGTPEDAALIARMLATSEAGSEEPPPSADGPAAHDRPDDDS
ncbi:hypothetical protein ACIRD8_25495 [Streptomyces sp. NPDC102451]|uniref:effector-associated constant component EACC1 n=1 Tax=Streptomyces sp. NPDC102451 TaxID=3366177 RepID=UPI003800D8A8